MAGDAAPPILDLEFDSGTLSGLRAEVHVYALLAGLPEGRAADAVLAVHELAANAVRHGAGAGRLRIWSVAGGMHCRVDDGHPPASSAESAYSWPVKPGQGLWLARQVADRMQILSCAGGTRAMVTFTSGPAPARSLPRRG
jgi:anti-sigma regulatory factor (Ser/Thr protein kinase)